jgi:hypothetical protein
MDSKTRNGGIIVYGGTINSDQIAVGNSASVHKNITSQHYNTESMASSELIVQLNDLVSIIKSQVHNIECSKELLAASKELQEELSKPKHSKITITELLSSIASNCGSLTKIASVAIDLKNVISTLL